MLKKEKMLQFISIANKAREIFPKVDSIEFNQLIDKLVELDSFGFSKSDLILYIKKENGFSVLMEWEEKLILSELRDNTKSDSFINAITIIENVGSDACIDKAREIVISKMDSLIEKSNFYCYRQGFIEHYADGMRLFPKFLFVKNYESLAQIDNIEINTPISFIHIDEHGTLTIDELMLNACNDEVKWYDEQLENGNEDVLDTFNDPYIMELFQEEEKLYKDCFVNGIPNLERLKLAAPYSSKAYFMMLKVEKIEVDGWF